MNVEQIGSLILIDDTYNANPESMTAALATLQQMRAGGRKIFVAGDMLELGNVIRESGSEANNGHDLIRQADFTPTVVTYLPFMQAYIGDA